MALLLALLVAAAEAGAPDAGTAPPPALRLADLQQCIAASGVDGWLFASERIPFIGDLPPQPMSCQRNCWYLVPAKGQPKKLVRADDKTALEDLPGDVHRYATWREEDRELAQALSGTRKIGMSFMPHMDWLFSLSAGKLERARSLGPTVVSAGQMLACSTVLSSAQIDAVRRAANLVGQLLADAFAQIHPGTDQAQLNRWLLETGAQRGLSVVPSISIKGDLADLHVFGRLSDDALAAANLSRSGWLGTQAPFLPARDFAGRAKAREAALGLIRTRLARGSDVTGAEIDDAVRGSLRAQGLAATLADDVGGSLQFDRGGVIFDGTVNRDDRKLLPGTCYDLLGSEFCILPPAPGQKHATLELIGPPPQTELPALLK